METLTLTKNFMNLANHFTLNESREIKDLATVINNKIIITDGHKILYIPSNNINFIENESQFKKTQYINFNFLKKYQDCEIELKEENQLVASLDGEMIDSYTQREKYPDISQLETDLNIFLDDCYISEFTLRNIKIFINEIQKENKIRKLKKQPKIEKTDYGICFKSVYNKHCQCYEIRGDVYFKDQAFDEKFKDYTKIFRCIINYKIKDFEIYSNFEFFKTCLETMQNLSAEKNPSIKFSIGYKNDFGMFKFSLNTGEKILLASKLK